GDTSEGHLPGTPSQLFVVRLERDVCTVSADSSGELLHQRGYRGPQAKAPLRETLGAALVLAAGWDPATPLCDPLCGSGRIAIEAALIAAGRAPGAHRAVSFEKRPGVEARPVRGGETGARSRGGGSGPGAGAGAAARGNTAARG